MKHKNLKVFILIFIILLPTLFLIGCGTKTGLDQDNTFYYDNNININDINFSIKCSETKIQNTELDVTITATNTLLKDQIINLDTIKVVNEKTKVEYKYSGRTFGGDITLQYNIKTNLFFNTYIPSSYLTENYYIVFNISGKTYRINLYETPDELRETHTVSFKLFSYQNYSNVKNISVKDNKKCEKYIYESNDHLCYCDIWYTDEARTQEFNLGYETIKQDITLYGLKKSNVQSRKDGDTFIMKINYVPQDGILVIDNFLGSVCLSNFALYDNNNVKEIYLPKELKKIYSGNFSRMNNLTKIHFAGSEKEWNTIESSSTIPSNATMVFNSKY